MQNIISNALNQINIDRVQTFADMSIYPLLSGEAWGGPDYQTMRQAFESGSISIREINESGSVPELSVVNGGPSYVLLLDGEEIQGAKQNRVLNTSIFLPPNSRTIIPVSCTEQGRWTYKTSEFQDSGVVMGASLRRSKQAHVSESVRFKRGFRSDQGAVWDSVSSLHEDLSTASSTGAMRDAYEARKKDLDIYVDAFEAVDNQHGMAVFIRGQLAGIDIISRPEVLADNYQRLLSSYAMDAIRDKPSMTPPPKATKRRIMSFLKQVESCTVESLPSQGYGYDLRLEGKSVQGAALVADDCPVHLTLFRKFRQQSRNIGMVSNSQRRGSMHS